MIRGINIKSQLIKSCIKNSRAFSNSNDSNLSSYIRSAHCTEIFRAQYYKTSKAVFSISPGDLDDIIIQERVRPSLMLGAFDCLGQSLGLAARFTPSQISNAITKIVDDAAATQFNDSIRDISAMGPNTNEDVKETIKYHRDLTSNQPLNLEESNPSFSETTFILSTILSNGLNLTRKL